MTFKFDYVDEEGLNPRKIIAEGDGYFKVIEVKEAVSKSGNPQLLVEMMLKDMEGKTTLYTEYVLQDAAWKIHAICAAIGRKDLYSRTGELNYNHWIGEHGKCVIKTKKSPGYNDKSAISKYTPSETQAPPKAIVAPSYPENMDEIPF